MIAVAHHEIANLFFAVLFERRLVRVESVRGLVPLVKALIPHDKTHPVAKLKQFRRRRIMACANGVYAHITHNLQLAFHRAGIKRPAESALVVMQANAVKLDSPAVEMKSVIGGKFECRGCRRWSYPYQLFYRPGERLFWRYKVSGL